MSTLTNETAAAAIIRAAAAEFHSEADLATLAAGATTFTADPGPAVIAIGRVYAIEGTSEAVAIRGTATGNEVTGIGVNGIGPVMGVLGMGDDTGAGVFGSGKYGVMGVVVNSSITDGAAVYADGLGVVGVEASGKTAVRAQTNDPSGIAVDASGVNLAVRATATGVAIQASGSTAISASATGSSGVGVDAFGAQHGVRGASTSGSGVRGTGTTGVSAEGFGPTSIGLVANGATGLAANATTSAGVGALCHSSSGTGVRGFSETGIGVVGHSELGLGGDFGGKAAAIRLRPNEGSGPPNGGKHEVGEMYVDSNGTLFFCVKPNVWRKVVMT